MIQSKAIAYFSHYWHMSSIRTTVQRLAFPDCPPLIEIEKNVSLVFTNTHPAFTYPRTLPPQVIEVGGIHCRPAKLLPAASYISFYKM